MSAIDKPCQPKSSAETNRDKRKRLATPPAAGGLAVVPPAEVLELSADEKLLLRDFRQMNCEDKATMLRFFPKLVALGRKEAGKSVGLRLVRGGAK